MFCSYIVPKAVSLFTGDSLEDGMDFEPEDEYRDDENERGDEKVGGGIGLTFLDLAKTMGE